MGSRKKSHRDEGVAERWARLDPNTRRCLLDAGVTADQLVSMRTDELKLLPGVGKQRIDKIRRLFPAPPPPVDAVMPPLVPQAHGGALAQGPVPREGPTMGQVRKAATARFFSRLDRLDRIAGDELGGRLCESCGRGPIPVDILAQLRAIDMLGKFGPGTRRESVHTLDLQKAKDLVAALAGGLTKHVYPGAPVDDATMERVLVEWELVFAAFFPGS